MDELFARLGVQHDFAFILTFAALIWARMLAMVSVVPFLFGRTVPRTIRVGISVALTLYLYPLLAPTETTVIATTLLDLFILFLKEIFFGLIIGFSSAMIFYGFEAAGRMIDNQRGVSLARVLIPALGEESSISGNFLFLMTIVVYLSLGGHLLFLNAFFESYRVLPVLEWPRSAGFFPLMDLLGEMTANVLFLSVQISVPILIAIFLVDVILGVANRFAPQINVWELGFNLRGYVGILMLFLALTLIVKQMEHDTYQSISQVETVIERLKSPIPASLPVPEVNPNESPKQDVPVKSIPSLQ